MGISRERWRWIVAGAALGAAGLVALACNHDWTPRSVTTAPPDSDAAGDAAGARPIDACDLSTLRPPPPSTESQGEDISFTVAVSYFALRAPGDAGPPGLCPTVGADLDDKRTCLDERGETRAPGTCTEPVTACEWGPSCSGQPFRGSDSLQCDDVGGVDNALARLRTAASAFLPSLGSDATDPNRPIREARLNLLVVVSGYNGGPNDRDVSLAIFVGSGVEGVTPGPNAWDGGVARWTIDPTSVKNPDAPTQYVSRFTGTAYVNNYVLVSAETSLPVPFGAGQAIFELARARLIAEVYKWDETGRFGVRRGTFTGIASARAILEAIARVPAQGAAEPDAGAVCRTDIFEAARGFVCDRMDMAVDGGDCDSLSMGLGFIGVPAEIGPLAPFQQNPNACPPDFDAGGCPQ